MLLRCFWVVILAVSMVPGQVLAATVSPLSVPQPDPLEELWRWQVFSERDGLASVRIEDIAHAQDLVWFATDQGVSYYDGMLGRLKRIMMVCPPPRYRPCCRSQMVLYGWEPLTVWQGFRLLIPKRGHLNQQPVPAGRFLTKMMGCQGWL